MEKFKELSVPDMEKKVAQVEAYLRKMKNILVEKEMIEEVAELDDNPSRPCVRPCGKLRANGDGLDCSMCDVLYTKSKITNKNSIMSSIVFDELRQCDTFKEGVYMIICVKKTCPYRGPIYVGSAEDVRERCRSHKSTIINNYSINNRGFLSVHAHFVEHNDEDPLTNFRFCPVQEVLGGQKAREVVEAKLMTDFGTHGTYGFNEHKPRSIWRPSDNPQQETSPKSLVPIVRHPPGGSLQRFISNIEDRVWAAICIKNSAETTEHGAKLMKGPAQARDFFSHYFDLEESCGRNLVVRLKNAFNTARAPTNQSDQAKTNDAALREWFIWENKPSTPYIFIINPLASQAIEDALLSEKSSLTDLLVEPAVLSLNNKPLRDMFLNDPEILAVADETHRDLLKKVKIVNMLIDGTLPPPPQQTKMY